MEKKSWLYKKTQRKREKRTKNKREKLNFLFWLKIAGNSECNRAFFFRVCCVCACAASIQMGSLKPIFIQKMIQLQFWVTNVTRFRHTPLN
jgi:hypothetical protein